MPSPVRRLRQLVELLLEGAGLRLGGTQVGAHARQGQELLGVPAVGGRQSLDVGVEPLGAMQGLVGGEHSLGVLGCKSLPVDGGPGLHEHRPALRGPRRVQRTSYPEEPALMLNRVDPGGFGKTPVPASATTVASSQLSRNAC
nr:MULTISPECIES: hypothetical protein [Micrococcaceae]